MSEARAQEISNELTTGKILSKAKTLTGLIVKWKVNTET